MPSKHSEAIREGVQDYEYMEMLRNRIAELRKQDKTDLADQKQAVLDASLKRVIEFIIANGMDWKHEKNRSIMDQARIAILKALAD